MVPNDYIMVRFAEGIKERISCSMKNLVNNCTAVFIIRGQYFM